MTWTHGQRRQHLSHTHKMRPPIPRPAKLSNPPRLLPQTWVPRLRILLPQRHPLTRGTSLLRLRRKLRRIHGINQLLRNRNRIRGINRRVRLSGRPHRRVRVYRKARTRALLTRGTSQCHRALSRRLRPRTMSIR